MAGLGGLGGFLNSSTGGNMMQALGMSLMSSPRSAPLANFGKFYGGLEDRQMKQDLLDQERADTMASREAMAQALMAAGVPEAEAKTLSINTQAAKVRLDQIATERARSDRDSFMSGFGGVQDATQPATGVDLTYPGVSAPQTLQAPSQPVPVPTQTQFGLPGAAQLHPGQFRTDASPATGPHLEPVESIPQTARTAKPSGKNKTVDWLKQNDPEAAALVDQGFSPRDAFDIAQQRVKGRKRMDDTQAKLDALYARRNAISRRLAGAPDQTTLARAKAAYLDPVDSQIARLEKQQSRYAPPDAMRSLEMRAEAAGLEPGSPEYQKFMISGGRGALVNINNSPEGGMFAGMPKDIREEMFKRQGEAQDAADLIGVTNQGLQLLDQGAITGAGSGAKVAAIKWAQALGVPVGDDIASVANNTDAYRSIMAKAVGKVIKNFGSGTGLSDADRQYAERLAGGDTTLNEPAIRRILAAGVKSAKSKISNFNTMRDKVLGGDLSAMLNVQEPEDYRQPAAPSGAAPRARNPNTGETLEWDGSQWRPVQ